MSSGSDLQAELDWIQLRKELAEDDPKDMYAIKMDESKQSFYMIPVGMASIIAAFCYGFYHIHDTRKTKLGMSARIVAHAFTFFFVGKVFIHKYFGSAPEKE